MVGIVQEEGVLVREDGLRIFEGHVVLAEVLGGFCRVPIKADAVHTT